MKKINLIFLLIVASKIIVAQECEYKFELNVDKFTKDTTYSSIRSAYAADAYWGARFTKFKSKGASRLYINLKTPGSTLNVAAKGVKILLEDGTIIEKPDIKIDYSSITGSTSWAYSAFVGLEKEDIEKMISSPISDFQLYIYEGKYPAKKVKKYMEELKCLKDK